jgi:hypothetical protein
MSKLTKENIAEIRHAREVISTLQRMQDKIYDQLIKDIGFDVYEKENSSSPEAWLFDIVFNKNIDDLSKCIETLKEKIEQYSLN